MKLELTNFGCYDHKVFEFKDNNVTLIHGPSGSGKTTIIKSILFALMGVGKKIIKIGKKSCSVSLKLDDTLSITRSKRPNRLIVNNEYEDDVAQNIIYKKIGNHFNLVGCLLQKGLNNFITMSPSDKLSFIEHFAFDSFDVSTFKSKLKTVTKNNNIKLSSTSGKIEMCKEMIHRSSIPEETHDTWKDFKEEKTLSEITLSLNDCEKEIKDVQMEIQHICNHRVDTIHLASLKRTFEKEQTQLSSKIHDLQEQLEQIEYDPVQTPINIERCEQSKKYIDIQKNIEQLESEISDDTNRLEEMKQNEQGFLKKSIQDIQKDLWKDYSQKECDQLIENDKNTLSLLKQLEKQKSRLNKYPFTDVTDLCLDLEKLAKIKKSRDTYKCPSCGISLAMKESKLELICTENVISKDDHNVLSKYREDDIDVQIINLKERISRYEKTNLKHESVQQQIDELSKELSSDTFSIVQVHERVHHLETYMYDHISKQKQLLELQNKLEQDLYSESLKVLKKSIKKKKKQLKVLRKSLPEDTSLLNLDYIELVDKITTLKNSSHQYVYVQNLEKEVEQELNQKQKELDSRIRKYTDKYKKVQNIDEIDEKLEKFQSQLKYLYSHRKELQELYTQTSQYLLYKKEVDQRNELCDEMKVLQKEEKTYQHKVTDCETLKKKLLECQSICMTNMVHSINDRVNTLLEKFFPDEPMMIELKCFKEVKKIKQPCVNISVEYKGVSCDLSTLSGGELDRVILAFTLVFAEKFNVPFLLLDECTSSLDQELNTEVIHAIKTFLPDKTILMIAHQNIQGIYDHIVYL